jgi:hypothetical protein
MALGTNTHYIELNFTNLITLRKGKFGWDLVFQTVGLATFGTMKMHVIIMMLMFITMVRAQGIFFLSRCVY